jgi:hypothetical protein
LKARINEGASDLKLTASDMNDIARAAADGAATCAHGEHMATRVRHH